MSLVSQSGLIDISRRSWIDAARALAIVGMIETHVVNSFMLSSLRETEWFGWLNFFNGLVAPTFLWLAGFSHGLGLDRRASWEKWQTKVLGALRLLALAYALRIPTLYYPVPAPQSYWTIDVLHCLAMTQIITLLLERMPSRAVTLGLWAALTSIVVVSAPHAMALMSGQPIFDAWWRTDGGSLFPLLPWAGFFLGGALSASLRWPQWLTRGRLWLITLLVSFGLMTLAPWPFSKESPLFFLQRLGWLGLGLTALAVAFSYLRLPRWMRLLSQHSLSFYIIHLVLIEMTKSLLLSFGALSAEVAATRFSLPMTFGFYVFIFALTALIIWGLEKVKSLITSPANEDIAIAPSAQ
jgi:uncharacterized membrane protein